MGRSSGPGQPRVAHGGQQRLAALLAGLLVGAGVLPALPARAGSVRATLAVSAVVTPNCTVAATAETGIAVRCTRNTARPLRARESAADAPTPGLRVEAGPDRPDTGRRAGHDTPEASAAFARVGVEPPAALPRETVAPGTLPGTVLVTLHF